MRIFKTACAIITLILLSLTIYSAYSGYIDPLVCPSAGVWCLAFPIMGILAIILTIIWLICRGRIMAICGLITIIVCLPQILLICPAGHPSKPKAGEQTFRVMTYNVYYGIDRESTNGDDHRTFDYIMSSGADVVCLQEMYNLHHIDNKNLTDEQMDSVRGVFPYRVETVNHNMMALSKYPIKRLPTPFFFEIRYLFYDAYEVDINGNKVTILNLHLNSYDLSSSERKVLEKAHGAKGVLKNMLELYRVIMPKLEEAFELRAYSAESVADYCKTVNGPLIVCGDFNDVPGSWSWRTIMDEGMKDAYLQTCFGPSTTFNAHNLFFHIDQMLYRGGLRPLNVRIGDIKSSDHYPLMTDFAFEKESK